MTDSLERAHEALQNNDYYHVRQLANAARAEPNPKPTEHLHKIATLLFDAAQQARKQGQLEEAENCIIACWNRAAVLQDGKLRQEINTEWDAIYDA